MVATATAPRRTPARPQPAVKRPTSHPERSEGSVPSDDSCCPPSCESPLSLPEAERHTRVLKALADPQRLRIMALIAAQPKDEPLCVCDIETGFDLTQGTISHHLRVLREA